MAKDTFHPYCFFNGQIVPLEEAKVSVTTHALQYGTGVFGGIRGYLSSDGQTINLFRLEEHFKRIHRSSKLIKIVLPHSVEDLIAVTKQLVEKNEVSSDVYFRPFAYKSGTQLGPNLHNVADGFTMYCLPLGSYYDADQGLSLMVSSWTRPEDNSVPSRGKISGAYINSSLARDEADAHGFDDAIMLNKRGKVAEASAANLFMVRDGVLLTSPVYGDILEGITRRTVLTLAKELGIEVLERELDRTELYICEELFLCGTGAQITPVTSVDHRSVGEGKVGDITRRVRDRFIQIIRGESLEHGDWLTKVPVRTKV